ncbi:hypothetical protein [Pseudomonas aeruginosa]|uniref:hypothetical protein n=1 Tax=Pseudomonas aeruginosa TaxID=287 RepID=UPI003CED66DB
MPSLTVLERYGQVGEFAALLGAAELNAATDWDEQFLADKRGYTLNLSKPCLGTTQFYNRHVYGTLNLNDAESMSAYYAEMELADRLRGHPKES